MLCLLSGIFGFFFCLHDLRHETAHCLCYLVLLPPCSVGVGTEGESRVVVTQHTADGFHIHAFYSVSVAKVCPYDIITANRKSPVYQGLQVYGKVFHPFPNRKIEPRSSYIVGGVIVTTKTKYCLGGLSARPRNQDISSEKKKCPFFVPKIRCR